jgi:hypothetical protein
MKARYQAQLDVLKAEHAASAEREKAAMAADLDREKAAMANEYTQAQAVNSAYLDVGKGLLDRSIARATFVQGAAAAISAAYAAVLGLSFASDGELLPTCGIAPTLFLGLAIFLAAAYVSFVTKPGDFRYPPHVGALQDRQQQRRFRFVEWTRTATLARRRLLQRVVVSLGVGTILLPLPFLKVSNGIVGLLIVLGLVGIVGLPAGMARYYGDEAGT